MKTALRRLVLAVAMLLPAVGVAQQVNVEPPATQRCMQLAGGAKSEIEYPFELLKARKGGRVVVRLTFDRPDSRPRIDVLEHEGDREFVAAVETHVRRLRVPCLRSDEGHATLRQEYRFRPDEHHVVASEEDAESERRSRQAACLMHISGRRAPDYPMRARRDEIQGRVLARLRFEAPDQPPRVDVFHRPSAAILGDTVRAFAAGYRLPCLEGGPVVTSMQYVYRFEGEAFGFKAVTLPKLVGTMKNIRLQRVHFEFGEMGCPFDVTFTHWQPAAPNWVSTSGARNPRRDAFVQWLRDAQLEMPAEALDAVFGDTVSFTVPCGKIDLQPQEKS
jgi:hypothetical protein